MSNVTLVGPRGSGAGVIARALSSSRFPCDYMVAPSGSKPKGRSAYIVRCPVGCVRLSAATMMDELQRPLHDGELSFIAMKVSKMYTWMSSIYEGQEIITVQGDNGIRDRLMTIARNARVNLSNQAKTGMLIATKPQSISPEVHQWPMPARDYIRKISWVYKAFGLTSVEL